MEFKHYNDTSKYQGKTKREFNELFVNQFEYFKLKHNEFTLHLNKIYQTLRKVRNVKGASDTYYSINEYLKQFQDLHFFFISGFMPQKAQFLSVKDGNLCFLFEGRKWYVKEIPVEDFLKIFPKGLPQTERETEQWLAYVGYLAKQDIKKTRVSTVVKSKFRASPVTYVWKYRMATVG